MAMVRCRGPEGFLARLLRRSDQVVGEEVEAADHPDGEPVALRQTGQPLEELDENLEVGSSSTAGRVRFSLESTQPVIAGTARSSAHPMTSSNFRIPARYEVE